MFFLHVCIYISQHSVSVCNCAGNCDTLASNGDGDDGDGDDGDDDDGDVHWDSMGICTVVKICTQPNLLCPSKCK